MVGGWNGSSLPGAFGAATIVVTAGAVPPTAASGTAAAPSPVLSSEFIDAHPPYPQAHASTIVELADGTLAAAWFGGSGESRPDVRIWFSRRGVRGWETPVAVADGVMPD